MKHMIDECNHNNVHDESRLVSAFNNTQTSYILLCFELSQRHDATLPRSASNRIDQTHRFDQKGNDVSQQLNTTFNNTIKRRRGRPRKLQSILAMTTDQSECIFRRTQVDDTNISSTIVKCHRCDDPIIRSSTKSMHPSRIVRQGGRCTGCCA